MSEIIAVVSPAPVRRVLGAGVMLALGATLVWMGLSTAPTFTWRLALLGGGLLMLWGAVRMWQATAHRIELTETELRDSSGRQLAALDQIVGIDNGAFAIKPSSGFILKLATRHERAWMPGLWWRTSRRIGVGGVTGRTQAKYMAECLAARIAARDHQD